MRLSLSYFSMIRLPLSIVLLIITLGLAACKPLDPEKERKVATTRALALCEFQASTDGPEAGRATLIALLQQYPDELSAIEALALLESQAGHPAEASRLFAQLANHTPNDASYLRYAASEAAKAGLFADAVTYYTRYLAHEPEDAAAWVALASAAQAQGESAQALAAYQRALALDQDKSQSPLILDCLTLALDRQDIPLAEAYLEALRRQKGSADATVQGALFDLSALKDARPQALSALAWLDAHSPNTLQKPARAEKAQSLRTWKAAEDARIAQETEAEKARIAETNRQKAEAEAAEAARILAEAEAAKAQAAEAAANPPAPTAASLVQAAEEKAAESNYAEATPLYWKSLALDASSPEVWRELSQSALKSGAPEQAEMAALEALRRDSENLLYTLNLLDIMQQSATPERLLEELVRAKEHFPQSVELTYDLAHGYETLGHNTRNARIVYEEYLKMAPADHPHRAEAQAALARLNRGP